MAKGARTLVIGGDFNLPPYEYLDENNNPQGYNVELSLELAKLLGYKVRFNLSKWAKVRQWLDEGEIDLIQGMAYSPERAQVYHFSIPHSNTWRAIFLRKDSQLESFKELELSQILIQQGDIAQDFLSEIEFRGNKIDVPSQIDALNLLNSGKYDAAIVNYMHGRYVLDTYRLTDLGYLPEKIMPREYCFAGKDPELINEINSGLSMLKASGKLSELQKRWFSKYDIQREARKRFIRRMLIVLIPIFATLTIIALWIWFIKKKVKRQTQHLYLELKNKERLENDLRNEFQLFVSGPVVTLKLNLSKRILDSISGNVSQFGYTAGDTQNYPDDVFNVIYQDDRARVLKNLETCINNAEHSFSDRFRIYNHDQSISWVLAYCNIYASETGSSEIYGYLIDISKQKMLEEDLLVARNNAEAANTAKGHFLANMSHEIRTPLNGIMGFIQVLLQQEANPEQKELFHTIHTSGKRIMLLVNDILDFSRIESGKLELLKTEFSIHTMLDEIIKGFIYRREKPQIELRLKISEKIPNALSGDYLRLRQVFISLVHHALKNTSEGWIEISADYYTSSGSEVRLIFSVSDTGSGMDTQKQSDIFDNFERSDPTFNYLDNAPGMGLSIVKRLIEIMGGFIWVESEVNSGSAFFFIIPFISTASERLPESEAAELDSTGKKASLHILLVEDEPINQMVTKKQLERWNHQVTITDNGKNAAELCKKTRFDCILMDIQMPVLDGVASTIEIRKNEKISGWRTPIIAYTAAAMLGDRERFMAAGMDDYLSKPVDVKLLQELLNRIVR